jgi:aminobenzoyl-glutamate utilization protein B
MEQRAARALGDWLADHGFAVERGAGGLPTAFVARFGGARGPAIGLLAEYDALPGQGNLAVPRRAPDGRAAGHACGHNQLGPAQVGAAIAARDAAAQAGLDGRIVVLGCPAEELLWGKLALQARGAYAGLDALLTSHADYQNGAVSRPCLACVSGELVFRGVPSHAGRARWHNALEALELTAATVDRLRASRFHDLIIGHVVRAGGLMPSITPQEARLWLTVRHVSLERAEAAYRDVLGIAADAARAAGATVTGQLIAASRGYLPNDALAAVLDRSCRRVGPPAWAADDLAWMAALSRACDPGAEPALARDLALHVDGVDPYGQDDGEASWRIPLARVNWAVPAAVPLHHWAATALSGSPAGLPGPLMASEALALTVVELLAQPSILADARAELDRRVGGRPLSPPRFADIGLMTRDPGAFWSATWYAEDR